MASEPSRKGREMRRAALPLVVATGALCLAACSGSSGTSTTTATTMSSTATSSSAATSSSPASLDALVAASHTEKGLVIYGNPPPQLWKPLTAACNNQYPWITVTAT